MRFTPDVPEPRPDGPSAGDVTATFEVLASERRRYVLYYLTRYSPRSDVGEVVEFLLEAEPGAGPDDRERVELSLVHHHLPKLAEHDVVDYDDGRGLVVYRTRPFLESCLDHAATADIRAARRPGGLAAFR